MNAECHVVVNHKFKPVCRAGLGFAFGSVLIWSLSLALLLLAPAPAHAQLSTGDILGNVTDSSGSALAGAQVSVVNMQTHETHNVTADNSGEYVVSLLLPGQYSVSASAHGFQQYRVDNITLAVGDRRRVTLKLNVTSVTQTVLVSAAPPALETDSTALGTDIQQKAVQDLPLNGRNYVQLAELAAGANEGTPATITGGSRPDDKRQSSSIVVSAQSDTLNNQMIDGVDNNEGTIGTIGVRPSIDAIAELRVLTNLYPAEAGKTPGAVVNIITRGGGNEIHGGIFEYVRNDAVDSRNFFATTGSTPELRQNQFGGSIGGPILKDKAFYFGDYEGLRIVQGSTTVNQVPTTYQVANPGDFSDVGGPVVSPATFSTPGLNFFKLYPAPNSGTNNFIYSPIATYYSTTVDARGDYRFNDYNSIFARYTLNKVAVTTPSALPAVTINGVGPIDPGGNASYPGSSADTADQALLDYTHVFSQKTSMELKAGYTYILNSSLPLNYGKNFGNALGVPNANLNLYTSMLPSVSVTGYASLGDSSSLPLYDRDNTFQYSASVVRLVGKHTLKFGATLIRRQIFNEEPTTGAGSYSFTTQPGSTLTTNTTLIPLINLLQGKNYSVQRVIQLQPRYLRTWEPSVYVQDDWRATPTLTLNLGLRYDIFTPDVALGGNISNFDTKSGQMLIGGVNASDTAGVVTDFRAVGPRAGFAYSATPRTVIRGGFGLVFFRDNTGPSVPFANPPYVSSYIPNNLTTTFDTPLPTPTLGQASTLPTGYRGMATDYRNSFVEQGNLNIQQDIYSFVVSVAYVGQWGHKLHISPDRNAPLPSPLPVTTRRPFYAEYPNVTSILHDESAGFSNFNSLQATVEKHMGHGLDFNANYTWAKALSDVQAFSAGGLYTSAVPTMTATLEYGPSELDVQHRFALMLNYELPFGKNYNGVKGVFLKGWQFNAIDVWETGQPFTVTNASPLLNTGEGDRPNQVANPTISNPSIHKWFNTTHCGPTDNPSAVGCAFQAEASGIFNAATYEHRNILFGPHYRHFDPSVFKNFAVTERLNLQLRVEAFNLTNTPNFGQPAAAFPSATIGVISSTRTGSTPRQMQGSIRLSF